MENYILVLLSAVQAIIIAMLILLAIIQIL